MAVFCLYFAFRSKEYTSEAVYCLHYKAPIKSLSFFLPTNVAPRSSINTLGLLGATWGGGFAWGFEMLGKELWIGMHSLVLIADEHGQRILLTLMLIGGLPIDT